MDDEFAAALVAIAIVAFLAFLVAMRFRHRLSKHVAMSWAQRLKRVFAIDIATCRRCGGKLRVIASIEDPTLIERILAHVKRRSATEQPHSPFNSRAPPAPLPLS